MKRLRVLILPLTLAVMLLVGCGQQPTASSEKATQKSEKTATDTAKYEDTSVQILNGDVFQTDDGSKAIRVHLKYTNNSSDGMYLSESFAIKAFQNDKELEDITDVNETADVGDSAQNIKEVKDGASVNGSYVFKLSDDSEVEVRVCTPTADEDVLAKKVFTN
jgi:ABC-type glycerol-3-phosphate transport system substrate-binding protein